MPATPKTPTNPSPIFGRADDLTRLHGRIGSKGLTALTGRPQIGKSRLLEELIRTVTGDGEYLVGYAQSTGEKQDLLLRTLVDLYTRWLNHASYLGQARSFYERHRGSLIGKVGVAVGKLLAPALKLENPTGITTAVVNETLGNLTKAEQDLATAGIQLPRLSYDLALELVHVLHKLSERRVVLIMDALEQSPAVEEKAATLAAIMRRLEEWPPCHVIIALRDNKPEHEAYRQAESLVRSHPAAEMVPLSRIELKHDLPTRDALLAHVREIVPAARKVADQRLIELIDGHPGVLYWWFWDPPANEAGLVRRARDAHAYRYDELIDDFRDLIQKGGDELNLCSRLALFPEIVTADDWAIHESIVLGEIAKDALPRLQSRRILDPQEPYPTFGHTTRYEAARRWWGDQGEAKPFAREEAAHLIVRLASRIRSYEPTAMPFAQSLISFLPVAGPLRIAKDFQALIACGLAVSQSRPNEPYQLLVERNGRPTALSLPRTAALVSMGLFNTLNDARAEDDLERRDRLLDELRARWPPTIPRTPPSANGWPWGCSTRSSTPRPKMIWSGTTDSWTSCARWPPTTPRFPPSASNWPWGCLIHLPLLRARRWVSNVSNRCWLN